MIEITASLQEVPFLRAVPGVTVTTGGGVATATFPAARAGAVQEARLLAVEDAEDEREAMAAAEYLRRR